MYSFVNTNEKITSDPEVIKALGKLEDLDVKVSVKRGDKSKGEPMFICKIAGEGLNRVAGGEKPHFAVRNTVKDFVKDYRDGKDKTVSKRMSEKRKPAGLTQE